MPAQKHRFTAVIGDQIDLLGVATEGSRYSGLDIYVSKIPTPLRAQIETAARGLTGSWKSGRLSFTGVSGATIKCRFPHSATSPAVVYAEQFYDFLSYLIGQ